MGTQKVFTAYPQAVYICLSCTSVQLEASIIFWLGSAPPHGLITAGIAALLLALQAGCRLPSTVLLGRITSWQWNNIAWLAAGTKA